MAPPFLLEALKPSHETHQKNSRFFNPKNSYSSPVKVQNWQYSDWNNDNTLTPRSNNCSWEDYKTTYEHMNDSLNLKDNYEDPLPTQHFFNYFGYKDSKTSDDAWQSRDQFPLIFHNDHNICPTFDTTMQKSYTMPYPMVLKDARRAEYCYMKHRRLKGVSTIKEITKFTDDREREFTRSLCAARGPMFISYNFMTGLMTDGTLPNVLSFLEAGLYRQRDQ